MRTRLPARQYGYPAQMSYLLLALAFGLLLAGAVVFTNAVEWAGIRLGLGTGAVGSILAAVATALPESVVPIVAIISGEETGQIAIGSILGAPLLLATLAMLLVGISTHAFAGRREQSTDLDIHAPTTARDLVVFMVFLMGALVLGLVGSEPVRIGAAVVFVLAYGAYVWRTVAHGGESGEEPGSLYFDPSKGDPPANIAIVGQVVAGIAGIVGGAELFVVEIEAISAEAGVSALVLALILAPLATELPEKANSILWSRRGKDALALGNITGALVFQSMIPVAVGLAFTPWGLTSPSMVAIVCAVLGGAGALLAVLRRRHFTLPWMLYWAVLYAGFVVYVALFG
jgi:cation:H+ antiporter